MWIEKNDVARLGKIKEIGRRYLIRKMLGGMFAI